jgi:hypothetical protein
MNKHILNLAGELARALVAEQDLNWRCVYCADALRLLMDAMDDTVAITALQEAESDIRCDAWENLQDDEDAMYQKHQHQMRQIIEREPLPDLLRDQAF